MKKLIYISLLLLSISINTFAQKETSWWYFGYNSGLNFNTLVSATASDGTVVTNLPKPITGPLYTSEGCFTVSTYDGSPLFSSDGSTVYDKNGTIMVNGTGLLGGPSSTQSGIVIPKPGSTTEYYIVTVPQDRIADGIRYSVVDVSANGGLGVVTSKNNMIKTGIVYENIAAIPNSNGKDYWLIHRTEKTFYVWAITSSGIPTTPHQTLTNTSIVSTGAGSYYLGEMIASPDYTKIASFNWSGSQVISANFNPATGFVSGIQTQTLPIMTYAGTFSVNNQYIYISSGYNNGVQVYVNTWAGLRAGTASTFLAYGPSNLKPGIDGRLYGIQSPGPGQSSRHLYVVMNPNAGGTDVKYFPNYLIKAAYLGLPAFAAGFIRIIPKEQPFACTAHDRTYAVEVDLSGGNAPARLEWNFGDGSAIVNQTVTTMQSKYKQLHSYNNSGTYTIVITPYKANGTALEQITMKANIVDCTLKSNRMTRSDLLNSKQQQ